MYAHCTKPSHYLSFAVIGVIKKRDMTTHLIRPCIKNDTITYSIVSSSENDQYHKFDLVFPLGPGNFKIHHDVSGAVFRVNVELEIQRSIFETLTEVDVTLTRLQVETKKRLTRENNLNENAILNAQFELYDTTNIATNYTIALCFTISDANRYHDLYSDIVEPAIFKAFHDEANFKMLRSPFSIWTSTFDSLISARENVRFKLYLALTNDDGFQKKDITIKAEVLNNRSSIEISEIPPKIHSFLLIAVLPLLREHILRNESICPILKAFVLPPKTVDIIIRLLYTGHLILPQSYEDLCSFYISILHVPQFTVPFALVIAACRSRLESIVNYNHSLDMIYKGHIEDDDLMFNLGRDAFNTVKYFSNQDQFLFLHQHMGKWARLSQTKP